MSEKSTGWPGFRDRLELVYKRYTRTWSPSSNGDSSLLASCSDRHFQGTAAAGSPRLTNHNLATSEDKAHGMGCLPIRPAKCQAWPLWTSLSHCLTLSQYLWPRRWNTDGQACIRSPTQNPETLTVQPTTRCPETNPDTIWRKRMLESSVCSRPVFLFSQNLGQLGQEFSRPTTPSHTHLSLQGHPSFPIFQIKESLSGTLNILRCPARILMDMLL